MSKPRLTYFDMAASRGEECRLAFVIAGVEFEDNRVNRSDWSELKPKTPFGSMPVLEVEGRPMLAESNAILTYIGRRHGLLPKDEWELAHALSLLSAAEGVRYEVTKTFGLPDDEIAEARARLTHGPISNWAKNVEAQIKGPFVYGDAVGVVDIKLFVVSNWFEKGVLDHVPSDVLKGFPKLQTLIKGVKEHPLVVKWYSKAG